MLEISILDPVNGAVAAAVTNAADTPERLATLAAGDIFLDPVTECPGWYRQRRLMCELAQAHLLHPATRCHRFHARATVLVRDTFGDPDAAMHRTDRG